MKTYAQTAQNHLISMHRDRNAPHGFILGARQFCRRNVQACTIEFRAIEYVGNREGSREKDDDVHCQARHGSHVKNAKREE